LNTATPRIEIITIRGIGYLFCICLFVCLCVCVFACVCMCICMCAYMRICKSYRGRGGGGGVGGFCLLILVRCLLWHNEFGPNTALNSQIFCF